MIRRTPRGALLAALMALPGGAAAASDPVRSDEQVVLFPSFGIGSGDRLRLHVHGWIFEPERDSWRRNLLLSRFSDALDLEGAEENAIFAERAWPFLVDNERGKSLEVRVGARTFELAESDPGGHFTQWIEVSAADVRAALGIAPDESLPDGCALPLRMVLRDGDPRRFEGRVRLLREDGVRVISDLDDTVKVSDVGDHQALLRRTFLEPFEAVPGMADLYRALAAGGATFHYVSASPWQLHAALDTFLSEAGFPSGTLHLRRLRVWDSSFLDLFADPYAYKLAVLQELVEDMPARRFLLVGDSGEKDPEVYGELMRLHPGRMALAMIRDAGRDTATAERMAEAFRGVPPDRWIVFTDPATVQPRALDAMGPSTEEEDG